MLRQNLPVIRGLHLVFDLGLTFLSFHLTLLAQESLAGMGILDALSLEKPYQLLFFILPIWAFSLLLSRGCCEYRGKPFGEILENIGVMVLKGFSLLLVFLFFTQTLNQSRALVLIFLLVNFALLLSFRGLVSQLLGYLRKRGYNYKNILIIGTGAPAREFLSEIKANPEWGFRILRLLDWEEELNGKEIEGFPVNGTLKDLPAVLKNEHVDYVVFAVCKRFLNLVEGSLLTCEEMGVPACLLADFFPLRFSKRKVGEFQNKPALLFSTAPDSNTSLLLKSIGDRLFALGGIILLSPLLLFLSFLIKLTSKGPVLFRQERCGLNGKRFTMLKFRTMVENADRMKELLAGENEMDGPAFKMSEDPRLTRVGRILRKLSLDEFPQLFNVLRGEMSLVGPRPPLGKEVSQYDLWQRRRLSVKPGLTCLWQVNGRNNIKFKRWMEMDLEYIDNWSLWLDAKILLKTIPAVLLGTGAK
jgi:exopolysaccharide biosynthesis polyprenyl glycosylphosphotransferase